MSNFRIATQAVSVEVGFGTAVAPLVGTIFLRPSAAMHSGTETVRDRLDDESLFLPLRVEGSTDIVFVAKAQIRYLRAPTPLDEDASMLERAVSTAKVDIEVDSGTTLSGELFLTLPPGQSRMLDYLNAADVPFLCLGQGADDCFVNRSHVRLVRELPA